MGVLKKIFAAKLEGSLLLESMISMVIVMTCFGVGIVIYANIMSTDENRLRLRAGLVLEETAIRAKTEKRFLNETIEMEPLRIVKIFSPYENAEAVQVLRLEAYDAAGKKLAERLELIAP